MTLKKIGKGTFTTAYLMDDKKTVLLKSTCPIKECMACGWYPDSYLFPEVNPTNKYNEYTMAYYPRVSSLKNTLSARQYRLYKALRALPFCSSENKHMSFHHWHDQFNSLPAEFKAEKQALSEALDACKNYGSDIAFEISPRNIAVKGRKLVLLDCFFSISKLQEVRANK
jgi:hypothetical protein